MNAFSKKKKRHEKYFTWHASVWKLITSKSPASPSPHTQITRIGTTPAITVHYKKLIFIQIMIWRDV